MGMSLGLSVSAFRDWCAVSGYNDPDLVSDMWAVCRIAASDYRKALDKKTEVKPE